MRILQTGNPRKLTLRFSAEVDRARAIERISHSFIGYRFQLTGEWFSVKPEVAIEAVQRAMLERIEPPIDFTPVPQAPKPEIKKLFLRPRPKKIRLRSRLPDVVPTDD